MILHVVGCGEWRAEIAGRDSPSGAVTLCCQALVSRAASMAANRSFVLASRLGGEFFRVFVDRMVAIALAPS